MLYARPELLLDQAASADASLLLELASRGRVDTGRPVADHEFRYSAVLLVAWFHRMRAGLLPEAEARASLRTSQSLFASRGRPDEPDSPSREATGEEPPNRAEGFRNLSRASSTVWEESGRFEALDRAIVMGRKAVEEGEPGTVSYAGDLDFLCAMLRTRSEVTGSQSDAGEAVEFGTRARSVAEETDDGLSPGCLHHLGLALAHRSRVTGNVGDLDDAIAVHHEAIGVGAAKGVDARQMAAVFQGLGTELLLRHQANGDRKDLDAAIAAGGQAVARAAEPTPGMLQNLCYTFTLRSHVTGSTTDLSDAIRFGQEAVDAAPVGHPDRPAALNDLSVAWQFRDMDKAITLAREAVELSLDRGSHDVRKAIRIANLAQLLGQRFPKGGRPEDIDEAIDLVEQSLELVPRHHPKRAQLVPQLVMHLGQRFKAFRRLEDLRRLTDIQRDLTIHRYGA
ncbi:tetratricopeptide repeat protein [Streptomyces canus]|uniref:tetratricopeptide repeat protein n=1 Tax=Streptomyces canus TaxID=58343 RepID=UPI00324A453F